jgi:hypothetical protein
VFCTLVTVHAVAIETAADNQAYTATKNVFDLMPPPELVGDGKQLMWKLQPREFAVGLFLGLVLALYSIYKFGKNGLAARALLSGHRGSFSRYGHVRALLLNGFVWVYVLLVVSLAGFVYCGFFDLVRGQLADTLPVLVSWGPAGASVLATFLWTQLAQRFSWLKAEGGLDLEEIFNNLEEQFTALGNGHWLLTLTWSSVEDARQAKIADLAYPHSVGLIRLAARSFCESAVDQGRLTAGDVSALLTDLDNLRDGNDDRQRFTNRRRAIQISSRIMLLEELEQIFQRHDRRETDRRGQRGQAAPDEERRWNADQRIDGALVAVAA